MGSVHAHSHNRPDNVMMGQGFVDSGNGLPFGRVSEAGGQFTSRNLPLSASCLMSSSSVPTLYSKSVISCAPSHYNTRLPQRHAIHSPQASDSIPEIVLTGQSFFATALNHCNRCPCFTQSLYRMLMGCCDMIFQRNWVQRWAALMPVTYSPLTPSKVSCPWTPLTLTACRS